MINPSIISRGGTSLINIPEIGGVITDIRPTTKESLSQLLRIDNGGLALISLRFTFLLIALWLFGLS